MFIEESEESRSREETEVEDHELRRNLECLKVSSSSYILCLSHSVIFAVPESKQLTDDYSTSNKVEIQRKFQWCVNR